MSAGDDILNTLFRPVYLYLRWYFTARQNNNYLYCGLDHEPDCFDAPSLCKLAELLSDDRHDIQFIDIHAVTEYVVCDFCGLSSDRSVSGRPGETNHYKNNT